MTRTRQNIRNQLMAELLGASTNTQQQSGTLTGPVAVTAEPADADISMMVNPSGSRESSPVSVQQPLL